MCNSWPFGSVILSQQLNDEIFRKLFSEGVNGFVFQRLILRTRRGTGIQRGHTRAAVDVWCTHNFEKMSTASSQLKMARLARQQQFVFKF